MKNRILFILLFIIIAIIGLNGTKITDIFLGINDNENIKKPRSSDNSAAIYLSDEISFNPMDIVDKDNSRPVSAENDSWYGNCRFDICDIMDSLIRNISIYSEITEYVKPIEAEITDSIYSAPNGLYYIEKHPYYNKFNNKRYVDLIMDSEDLSILYINFYDDQQHSVSSEAVQRGIDKLDKMSTEFYSQITSLFNSIDIYGWFIGLDCSENDGYLYFDTLREDTQYAPPEYKGVYDLYISNVCEDTKKSHINDTNPMSMFFIVSSAPNMIQFNDIYYNDPGEYDEDIESYNITRSFTSSMKFIAECVHYEFNKNVEYAAYSDKIYMTHTIQNNKKIIIYNVLTDEIEGFCTFYNYDAW